jgi:hypothetical protein
MNPSCFGIEFSAYSACAKCNKRDGCVKKMLAKIPDRPRIDDAEDDAPELDALTLDEEHPLAKAWRELELRRVREEEARQAFDIAQEVYTHARKEFFGNVGAYIEDPDRDAVLKYIYWHSEFLEDTFASVMGCTAGDLRKRLKIKTPQFKCSFCGKAISVKSRTEVAALLEGTMEPMCHRCKDEKARKHWIETQAELISRSGKIGVAPMRIFRLQTMPYGDYLWTPEWRATRLRALIRAEFKCSLCGSTELLQVHHLAYERRGCEQDEDLVVLCTKCHQGTHGINRDFLYRPYGLRQGNVFPTRSRA